MTSRPRVQLLQQSINYGYFSTFTKHFRMKRAINDASKYRKQLLGTCERRAKFFEFNSKVNYTLRYVCIGMIETGCLAKEHVFIVLENW